MVHSAFHAAAATVISFCVFASTLAVLAGNPGGVIA